MTNSLTLTTTPIGQNVYNQSCEGISDFHCGRGESGSPLHHLVAAVNTCMALTATGAAKRKGFPYANGKWEATITYGEVEGRPSAAVKSIHSVVHIQTSRPTTQVEIEDFYDHVEKSCFITNILVDAGVKFSHEIKLVEEL